MPFCVDGQLETKRRATRPGGHNYESSCSRSCLLNMQ